MLTALGHKSAHDCAPAVISPTTAAVVRAAGEGGRDKGGGGGTAAAPLTGGVNKEKQLYPTGFTQAPQACNSSLVSVVSICYF